MLQAEIRDAVRRELRRVHGSSSKTLYRYELGLCLGETRVDVAAINGQITGCEIKGDRDRLDRLPRQVELYGRVLDEAIIVTEAKHAPKVLDCVPDWWGVWTCVKAGRWAKTEEIRRAGRNPQVEPLALAQLLWRSEVFEELVHRDLATGLRTATRWRLWDVLVEELTIEELGRAVRQRLRARQGW